MPISYPLCPLPVPPLSSPPPHSASLAAAPGLSFLGVAGAKKRMHEARLEVADCTFTPTTGRGPQQGARADLAALPPSQRLYQRVDEKWTQVSIQSAAQFASTWIDCYHPPIPSAYFYFACCKGHQTSSGRPAIAAAPVQALGKKKALSSSAACHCSHHMHQGQPALQPWGPACQDAGASACCLPKARIVSASICMCIGIQLRSGQFAIHLTLHDMW